MDARTIKAIHKSIAHWNLICYGMEDNCMSDECALCDIFLYNSVCSCPLFKVNGNQCCNSSTVWGAYATSGGREKVYCTVVSAEEAEAMLETLVGLLPKGEQGRYNVKPAYTLGGDEWCTHDGSYDISGRTGITTDGRNRFPQAEEVWRKVFERQAHNKKYSAEAMLDAFEKGTYIHITGNCPTCGQKVKRKVTKYRVAYNASGIVTDSMAFYRDKDDWDNKVGDGYEFIGLIKSTAEEFDV